MTVDVTVNPDVPLLCLRERLEEVFCKVHFWLELDVRIDPLPIQVQASDRISVVAADHSVRVENRYQHKCVKLSEEARLLPV